jgi:hypothetical protein
MLLPGTQADIGHLTHIDALCPGGFLLTTARAAATARAVAAAASEKPNEPEPHSLLARPREP